MENIKFGRHICIVMYMSVVHDTKKLCSAEDTGLYNNGLFVNLRLFGIQQANNTQHISSTRSCIMLQHVFPKCIGCLKGFTRIWCLFVPKKTLNNALTLCIAIWWRIYSHEFCYFLLHIDHSMVFLVALHHDVTSDDMHDDVIHRLKLKRTFCK